MEAMSTGEGVTEPILEKTNKLLEDKYKLFWLHVGASNFNFQGLG